MIDNATDNDLLLIAVDKSLVSKYVLKPYWWSQVIELFPLSMAPNAITLSGFGVSLFCYQRHTYV